jgi:hypothetical protein
LALHWPLCKFLHALPSYPRAIRTHLCCHCGFVVSFVTICLSHSFFAWPLGYLFFLLLYAIMCCFNGNGHTNQCRRNLKYSTT